MGDRVVSVDSGDGRFHVSLATLVDIVTRDNVDYLQSMGGAEELVAKLGTSAQTGLSADEADDNFTQRKAAYVQLPDLLFPSFASASLYSYSF